MASGERTAKTSPRIEAMGSVDETNACIGLARAAVTDEPELARVLDILQHRLFDLGADLAQAGVEPRITVAQASALETEIDSLEDQLSPLKAFILPGGAPAAAALHLARTVCRRAERDVIRLAGRPGEGDLTGARLFLNRLSDLLFVAARYANRGEGDVLWRGLA